MFLYSVKRHLENSPLVKWSMVKLNKNIEGCVDEIVIDANMDL